MVTYSFFFQDSLTSICNLSSIFEWMLDVIKQDILDLTDEAFKTVKTQVLREKNLQYCFYLIISQPVLLSRKK